MQGGIGEHYKKLLLKAVLKVTEENSKANLHLSFLRRAVRDRMVVALEYLERITKVETTGQVLSLERVALNPTHSAHSRFFSLSHVRER